ncbi:hypothetical protein SGFS_065070 [Streptomyces graminofaciens]|uniref:DUF222 domain-containing protein n=1 Tax=Streptomyces graminofaciens TaxID=68212 RepID=A0ABN5VP21_9ACTN|nr:hypothetical protein [Streptomyces graminofaciens]BBC35213.1 hypothetical protein SGFS_065070 [Streptomyces graminofaciens]
MSADESITSLSEAVAAVGALPMPAGPAPVEDDRVKAPWGRGEDGRPLLPMGAHWTDVPELVDQEVARIRGRVDQARSGSWYVSPVASDLPGTVRTNVDGYQRTVGQFTNVLPADLDLVIHAHDDLGWCLEMIAKFRARVIELEAERHVTNEALDDAVQALRAIEAPDGKYPPALPWAALLDDEDRADFLDELAASAITHATTDVALAEVEETCKTWRLIAEAQHGHNTAPGPELADEDGCTCPETDRVEPHWSGCPEEDAPCPVDGPIPGVGVGAGAPEMRALRAALYGPPDGEHYAAVHHTYRVGHDLPETGGLSVRTAREDDDPARCLKVHHFSPRDGWRMVCGNCDHGKDADCHQVGA